MPASRVGGHVGSRHDHRDPRLVYADDPQAARAFFRDVLCFPFVEDHPGWLIFGTGPSELGVHPTAWEHDGQAGSVPMSHQLSFVCDDLPATMAELSAKGAVFSSEPADQGWGITVMLQVPGAQDVMLYQPRHTVIAGSPH